LRDELRWLGGELGPVRDRDVLLDRLHGHARTLADNESFAAERVLERLEQERLDARRELLAALRSERYLALLDRLVDASQHPCTRPEATRPALRALPRLARKPWRRLGRAMGELGEHPTDQELHAARILTKRARYATEAVVAVTAPSYRRFAKALARLQDVLGEHQDTVVARDWLRKAGADVSSAEAYAAGVLAGIEVGAAAAARAALPAAWAAVRAAHRPLR
jgi:CHAD domain-containing protein